MNDIVARVQYMLRFVNGASDCRGLGPRGSAGKVSV